MEKKDSQFVSFNPDNLSDTITSFVHHVALLPQLEQGFSKKSPLALVTLDIGPLDFIEQSFGLSTYKTVLKKISGVFEDMSGNVIRDKDYIAMSELGSTSFMIFLSGERKQKSLVPLSMDEVFIAAKRIYYFLMKKLVSILGTYCKGLPPISFGYALANYNPLIRKRRLIARLIDESREMSRKNRRRIAEEHKNQLQKIILNQSITTVFQPIVSLHNQSCVAFEALSRGPKGSLFESPLVLYATAEDSGLELELDRICRRKAIENSQHLDTNETKSTIFINTLPDILHDPDFQTSEYPKLLRQLNKTPNHIIFEINERSEVVNYDHFRKSLNAFRKMGTYFALDDIGSGYSSLAAIMEIRPKFIKIDKSLCQNIRHDSTKLDTLTWFKSLSVKNTCRIVAEGIEHPDDLKCLQNLGIDLIQGYLFSKPLPPKEAKEYRVKKSISLRFKG